MTGCRENPPVRAAELKLAVGQSIELVALLMHGAMMPPTEHGQIRECRRASLSPVTDMVALAEARAAAWEAAAAVSVV